MLGCVFSPGYFQARQGEVAPDPLDYAAVNVALKPARGRKRWVMTEYDRAAVSRERDHLQIGGAYAAWRDDHLEISFAERTAPFGRPLEGRVRLTPLVQPEIRFELLEGHVWQPIAPLARVEVELSAPELRFSGLAYHDFNMGPRGLEEDFDRWDWYRAQTPQGAAIVYDVWPRGSDTPRDLAGCFTRTGTEALQPAPRQRLRSGLWGVKRFIRPLEPIEPLGGLEDGPFYVRGAYRTATGGEIVHESLDLRRFSRPWVRRLLPFRMRRGGASP